MAGEPGRRTPDDLLREVQAEEAAARQPGQLKIILGYASGVGKTVRMLEEARRRRDRGQDVVVGAVQPQAPAEARNILDTLELIPLQKVGDGEAVDVEALVRRKPALCVIDGLAYNNPPAARNPARWQDVRDLVEAGIKVVTSINIQYIEELRDEVEALTGKHVTQTVPLSFIHSADEVEIVDVPAEEPMEVTSDTLVGLNRQRQKLSKLRELALVVVADVVDRQLSAYLERQGLTYHPATHERILVCITPRANVQDMIETAQIIADRFHGELIVAYVNQPDISSVDEQALNNKLALARSVGASIELLEGNDPVQIIVDFARLRGITQLFIGHTQRTGVWSRLWGSPVDRLIRLSRGMDVRIFPQ